MRKNDIVELNITDTTAEGSGVGRDGGMVVFVPGAFTGDVLRARIIKCTKKYCVGRIEELLSPSKNRVAVCCNAFPACGGCMFPHVSYQAELDMKRRWVEENFRRIGGVEIAAERVVPSPLTEGYRNKGVYPLALDPNGNVRAGFYARHSHRIAGTPECALHPAFFGDIVKEISAFLQCEHISIYDETSGEGLARSIFLRYGEASGETLVCLVVNGDGISGEERLAERLQRFPQVSGLVINVNTASGNALLGPKCRTVWGKGVVTDELCGLSFDIAPTAFYQVNRRGAELLYGIAAEYAAPEGGLLIDLYCGAGTIGLSMASRAGRVIGAEIVPSAVENARANALRNGIANAEFILADATDAARELERRGERPDVVVLDPPRAGCDAGVIDAVANMAPRRVVMVSCNSATAARDTALFISRGYLPRRLTVVDMFPRTGHVETVVLLSKGEIDSKKVRVEFSLENMDMSGFQKGATYPQIKEYVQEHSGLKVSSLYISQVKRKCGLDVGQNYNLSKKEGAKQPQCPPDKEKAITEVLQHFGMV